MDPDSAVAGEFHRDESPPIRGGMPIRLGDFRILREVGKGGMGIVYEAVQESLGRRVALKVLAHHSMLFEANVQRFQQESRAAASLHHTNIVPVFGVGDQDGLHYYVMQFIDGLGLNEVLRELSQHCGGNGKISSSNTTKPGLDSESVPDDPSSTERPRVQSIAQSLLTGRFADDVRESPVPEAPMIGARDPMSSAPHDELAELLTEITTRPDELSASSVDSQVTQAYDAREADGGPSEGAPLEPQPDQSSPVKLNRCYWLNVAQLGVQVADAMDYAHGHGVLHRDIKPSNLLVDSSGTVWVTDFGLAKARGHDDLTLTGDIVGTVRYMAPERFEGAGDVRSDIYSLGLTLYELLTHRPAFREPDRHRLLWQVLNDEPPRPRRLRADIPRDLETIVLKAAAREPQQRYQAPREIADDLKRFLADQPIAARQENSLQRFRRSCRRNPLVSVLSAVLCVILIVGISGVVRLWRDAEHHSQLLTMAEAKARGDRDIAVAALEEAREQRIVAEASRDEAREQRTAVMAANAEAQRAIEAAIQAEAKARKSEAEVNKKLELSQSNLADFERERQLTEKRIVESPTRADYQAIVASNFHNLAGLQYASGKTEQAIKSYQKAIEERAMLVADHPHVTDYQDVLAASYHSLAKVHQETGSLDEAVYYYTEAIAARATLLEQNSMTIQCQSALANSLFVLGELQCARGRFDDASRHLLKALQLQEQLAAANPTDTKRRRQLAITCSKLGQLNQELDNPADAIGFYRKAVEHWQTALDDQPSNIEHRLAYADGCRLLGDALRVANRVALALPWYSQSIQSLDGILESQPQHALAAELISKASVAQAAALTDLGRHADAVAALDRALQCVDERNRNRIRLARALALARAGKLDVATNEANKVGGAKDASPELTFMSARVFSVASLTVLDEKVIDNDVQDGLSSQLEDQAVEYLHACKDADFFSDLKNVEKLEMDADFLHLHQRPDIQTLLKDLQDAGKDPDKI